MLVSQLEIRYSYFTATECSPLHGIYVFFKSILTCWHGISMMKNLQLYRVIFWYLIDYRLFIANCFVIMRIYQRLNVRCRSRFIQISFPFSFPLHPPVKIKSHSSLINPFARLEPNDILFRTVFELRSKLIHYLMDFFHKIGEYLVNFD